MERTPQKSTSFFARIIDRAVSLWEYMSGGVWSDPRRKWWVNILRILNLSVKSFLNRDIQSQACAMTYRTLLAVVPALALLIAIGRGFGIQEVLQQELFKIFPAQKVAITYAMNFVESYLAQANEGLLLGVGIGFLLWTLISLISNVEGTFNYIWGVKNGRSLWRKISDYTTMLLILPLLMIIAGGISVLMSSTLNAVFHFSFMTPVIAFILEGLQVVMTFLTFAAVYMLIPNAKVRFGNALVSGVLAGTGFLVLQWLFVSGTLYVTRYNAIYGSFAFLPLLLLWMQLAWVICLAGAVICYSSQNVFAFNLDNEVSSISPRYLGMVTLAITAVITRRFVDGATPLTSHDLMNRYDIPARLVTEITDRLCTAGVVSRVLLPDVKDVYAYQLAVDPSTLTVASLTDKIYSLGTSGFIPGFKHKFPYTLPVFTKIEKAVYDVGSTMKLSDLAEAVDT